MDYFEDKLERIGRSIGRRLDRIFSWRPSPRQSAGHGPGLRERLRDHMDETGRALREKRERMREGAENLQERSKFLGGFVIGAALLLIVWSAYTLLLSPKAGMTAEDAALINSLRDKMNTDQGSANPSTLFPGVR